MSTDDFSRKITVVLGLLNLDLQAFKLMMEKETGKHRTTIAGWLNKKAVPTAKNRRLIERVLHIPEHILERNVEEISSAIKQGGGRIKYSAALDNVSQNESYIGDYLMFRYTFSNYRQAETHFIQSPIHIQKEGSTFFFDCDEPRYPFSGEVEFTDRNIAFLSIGYDTGLRLNMLVDKLPKMDYGADTPKYCGILTGTSFMDGMRVCSTKVLLLRRADYKRFCAKNDLKPDFKKRILAKSLPSTFRLPIVITKMCMDAYFSAENGRPAVIKA